MNSVGMGSDFTTRRVARALATAVLAASCTSANALLDVVPYVSAEAEHDSNVFRLEQNEESDTSYTYVAGVGVTYTFGQQALYLNGYGDKTTYRRFDELDFEGHGFDGGLNWRVTPNLSGTLFGRNSRRLEEFSDRAPGQQNRSLLDSNSIGGSANLRVLTDYEIRTRYGESRQRYSDDASKGDDRDDESVTLGLSYVGPTTLSIGIEGTLDDIDYIRRQMADGVVEDAEQFTLQLVGSWKPSSITSMSFTAGSTRRDNKGLNVDDDSGAVGSINLNRVFSVKTTGYLGLFRNISSPETQGEGTVVATGLNGGLEWRATPLFTVNTSYLLQREDYKNSQAIGGGEREDDLQNAALGLKFSPRKWISLGSKLGWEDRTSNVTGAGFDAWTVSAEIRLTYQ